MKSQSTTAIEGNQLADDNGNVYPVDIIVLANGFKAQQPLKPMKIKGLDGVELHRVWEDTGISAYMGYVKYLFLQWCVLS